MSRPRRRSTASISLGVFFAILAAFLAVNRDGTIRTFFKPNDGEAYFRRQASRTPGGGP
jgi:hypothetical protein